MSRRQWLGSTLAAPLAAGLAPNGAWAQSAALGPVHVGFVIDSSGPFVDASRDLFTGSKVHFDDLGSRGQLRGVRISQRQTDGTPDRTREAVLALARQDRVDVVIGPVGDAALLSLLDDPSFQAEGVPLVGPLSGVASEHPLVGRQVFFTRPDYRRETAYLREYLATLGMTEFGVVWAPSLPAAVVQSVRTGATQRLQGSAAATASTQVDLPPDSAGWEPLLAGLVQRRPRAIVVVGDSVVYTQVFPLLRRLSPGTLVVGLSTVNPRTVQELVPSAQMAGAVLVQVTPHPGRLNLPLARELDRAMKRFFDEPASHQTMSGYIAAQLILTAQRRSEGPGRERMRKALADTRSVDLGGFALRYGDESPRGSGFVDLLLMRANGQLMP
ncbi:MAG: ABC transporter substrate-binding protein [Rubrivivax sp.]